MLSSVLWIKPLRMIILSWYSILDSSWKVKCSGTVSEAVVAKEAILSYKTK